MARPQKFGLEYFPLDIDMLDDPKILRVEEKFGELGGYLAVKLLCWIYREGYYLHWDDNMSVTMARRAGKKFDSLLVQSIVDELIDCNFFSRELYDKYNILTSHGIQKRWYDVSKKTKRVGTVKPEFSLLALTFRKREVSSEETQKNEEENETKRHVSTQSESENESEMEIERENENIYTSPVRENQENGRGKADNVAVVGEKATPGSGGPPSHEQLDSIDLQNDLIDVSICLDLYFNDHAYELEREAVLRRFGLYEPDSQFPDQKVFRRWGLAFNRYLTDYKNVYIKTFPDWRSHLLRWFKDQPLHANPDEINQKFAKYRRGKKNHNNNKSNERGNSSNGSEQGLSDNGSVVPGSSGSGRGPINF